MAFRPHRKRKSSYVNYDQNDGKPGVVYILINEAFQKNYLKIGQTTYSGAHRAFDLNEKAGTGLPKKHVCVFEYRTVDCGRAEKLVHERLKAYRQGYQEFFLVEFEIAKAVIIEICHSIDASAYRAEALAQVDAERERQRLHDAAARQAQIEENQRVAAQADDLARKAASAKAFADQRTANLNRQAGQSQTSSSWGPRSIAPIDLFCPACQKELNATASSDELEKRFRCKNCQTIFTWHRFPKQADATRFAERDQHPRSFTVDEQTVRSGQQQGALPKNNTPWIVAALVIIAVIGYANLAERPADRSAPSTTTHSDPQPAPAQKRDIELTKASTQEAFDSAMRDVIKQYPYLATKSGEHSMSLINAERKLIESHGEKPDEALRRAVAAIASKHATANNEPTTKKRSAKAIPVAAQALPEPVVYDPPGGTSTRTTAPQSVQRIEPPVFDPGGHQGFPPQCRWLSQYEWSCK